MDIEIETEGHGANKLKDLGEGKKVLNILEKYYPGHDWFVNCCHQAGTISVQLMYEGLNREVRIWKYGFLLHLAKLDSTNMDQKVRNAGGEVLERYNMARSAIDERSIVDFFRKGIDTGAMVN